MSFAISLSGSLLGSFFRSRSNRFSSRASFLRALSCVASSCASVSSWWLLMLRISVRSIRASWMSDSSPFDSGIAARSC